MLVDVFDRKTLWEGCILSTIVHAITVEEYPELSHEHSWDGMNYSVQDSCGCRGTITFHEKYLVAVFQDIKNKAMINKCIKKGALSILGIDNKEIESIAIEEALQYVLYDVDGESIPLITTGFWGICNNIFANKKFELINKNGAYIISNHLIGYEEQLDFLIEDYEIDNKLVKLIESIYDRKIRNSDMVVNILESEKKILMDFYGEELVECKQTFSEINVFL